MNLLIPYIKMDHPDPLFDEFTYGDGGQRARKMKKELRKGDYIFFHTSRNGKKIITAYYVVDRVLDTTEAFRDKAVKAKYKNPHLLECADNNGQFEDDNAIVFGDPITSRILDKPLIFTRKLAESLSLGMKFHKGKTETQIIGSATRSWRELSEKDVRILLISIEKYEKASLRKEIRTSEEVAETLERDIESYIAKNPKVIGKQLRLSKRQYRIGEGRADLLLEDKNKELTLLEIKLGFIGHDALQQITSYIEELSIETKKKVNAVIVCAGVMPAYMEEISRQKNIKIMIYGWELSVNNFIS
jgi:hypothetical protein